MTYIINRVKAKSGVLLIELLIALSIAAVLFTGILSVLRGGLAAYQKVDTLSIPIYQARAFFALLESQLHNMIYYSEAPFIGDRSKFTFPSMLENYSEDTLRELPFSVTYQYREKSLYRTETPLRGLFTEKEEHSKKILASLNSFVVQYAYRQSENPDIVWLESWPANQGLPRGLKISLAFAVRSGKKQNRTENFVVTKKFFIPHGNWGWIEKGF